MPSRRSTPTPAAPAAKPETAAEALEAGRAAHTEAVGDAPPLNLIVEAPIKSSIYALLARALMGSDGKFLYRFLELCATGMTPAIAALHCGGGALNMELCAESIDGLEREYEGLTHILHFHPIWLKHFLEDLLCWRSGDAPLTPDSVMRELSTYMADFDDNVSHVRKMLKQFPDLVADDIRAASAKLEGETHA